MTDRIEVLTQRPTERTGHEGQSRHHATSGRGSNGRRRPDSRCDTPNDVGVDSIQKRPYRMVRGEDAASGCALPVKRPRSAGRGSWIRPLEASTGYVTRFISRHLLVGFGRRVARADFCGRENIWTQGNLQRGNAPADPVMDPLIVIAERLRQRPNAAVLLQYRLNRKDDCFTHGVNAKPFHGVNQRSV